MTKASILVAAILAFLAGPMLHAGVPATSTQPHIGPFTAGMTFQKLREASPETTWKRRDFMAYNILHTRALYADDVLDWKGQRFNIVLERTGYPSSKFSATTFLPATDAKACGAAIAALADDVNAEIGGNAKDWKQEAPDRFGSADEFLDGFRYYKEAGSTYWNRGLPEAQTPTRTWKSDVGISLAELRLSNAFRPDDSKQIHVWRGYYVQDQSLVRILGSFTADSPFVEGAPCLAAVTFKTSGDANGRAVPNPPVTITKTWEELFANETLAQRYFDASPVFGEKPLPKEGAQYYKCDVQPYTGLLRACRADNMAQEISATDLFAQYLNGTKAIDAEQDEENFSLYVVNIPAKPRPAIEIPDFVWSKATQVDRVVGISGLEANTLVRSADYPRKALRGDFEAAIEFRCVILDDLSVFCGSMAVTPAENTAEFLSAHRILARRASARRVKPLLSDGTSAVGQYFKINMRFVMQ